MALILTHAASIAVVVSALVALATFVLKLIDRKKKNNR